MGERIQLSRRKGWRMPSNTVKVDRTTGYGNPFVIGKWPGDAFAAYMDGEHAPDGLMERIKGMEAEAKSLKADLAAMDATEQPITMHPAAAGKYARLVADLQKHVEGMKRGEPAEHVIAEVRKLIDRIVIEPSESRKPATITVHGLLAELLLASKGAPLMQGNIGCGDPQPSIPYTHVRGMTKTPPSGQDSAVWPGARL